MSDKEQKLIEDVKVNSAEGIVSFKRNYYFTPFRWPVYPFQRNKFALVFITSPDFLQTTTLFTQIKHAFMDMPPLLASNLHDASVKMCDLTTPVEEMKNRLAILDLTPTTEFKQVCNEVIPAPPVHSSLLWLQLLEIRRILMPNLMTKTNDPLSQLNYSYTIWLASKLDQVPTVLRSSAHMIIATTPAEINSLLEFRTGIKEITSETPVSFVITNTLSRDLELMTILCRALALPMTPASFP
jgi:hypothetical protein